MSLAFGVSFYCAGYSSHQETVENIQYLQRPAFYQNSNGPDIGQKAILDLYTFQNKQDGYTRIELDVTEPLDGDIDFETREEVLLGWLQTPREHVESPHLKWPYQRAPKSWGYSLQLYPKTSPTCV